MAVRLILALAVVGAVHTPHDAQERTEIPFTLHREHLVLVRGNLGPIDDALLLLDTGSGRTIIDTKLASALVLGGTPTELESFGQRVKGSEARVPSVRVGGFRTGEWPVVVTSLSATAKSVGLDELDGIVGVDILRTRSFALDFVRRRLRFGPKAPVAFRVSLTADPMFLTVTATVDQRAVRLIVDSGASHLVLFGDRVPVSATAATAQPSHLAGSIPVRPVVLGRVRLGSRTFREVSALVTGTDLRGTRSMDGLLSLRTLETTFVQFDFETGEIGWR